MPPGNRTCGQLALPLHTPRAMTGHESGGTGVLSAFKRAFGQLRDPRIIRVLALSLVLSAVLFVALWVGIGFLLTQTSLFQIGWLDAAVDILGGLATALLTFLLFPAVASTTAGFFLDSIAEAVEARHYPGLGPARRQTLAEVVLTSAKFLSVLVVLNLAMLVFLPFAPIFPFVVYGVNGYLLGREYFELVAARRVEPGLVRTFRRAHRLVVLAAGIIIAGLFTLPVVNLAAPVIGTAAMVHIFHGAAQRTRMTGRQEQAARRDERND